MGANNMNRSDFLKKISLAAGASLMPWGIGKCLKNNAQKASLKHIQCI